MEQIKSGLKFTHLWCQGSPVLFSYSLGKCWSVSCVDSGRLCSRPSHSKSFGGDCEPHEGRPDRSACQVVCPQNCSHIHQYWKPSVILEDSDKYKLSTSNLLQTLPSLCCMNTIIDLLQTVGSNMYIAFSVTTQ